MAQVGYKLCTMDELTTGDKALVYQKLDQRVARVAGGCWELVNNNTYIASSHRLIFKAIRKGDDVEQYAVRTIDALREKNGFEVQEHKGYEMSCFNPRCLNPAHQVKAKQPVSVEAVTPDKMDLIQAMRNNGWNTRLMQEHVSVKAYTEMLAAGNDNIKVRYIDLDFEMLALIADLYKDGLRPTFKSMLDATGLTEDELLPYGFAVTAIESRSLSPERALRTSTMLRLMAAGKSNRQIVAETDEGILRVQAFRGALYGG